MAKVGFWLKGANGKFAGATIFKANGVTQIREVVTPKNPRTPKQMTRRTKFLCPVKFFARAQQNFFPFAFEDKQQGWSEFNAFMHHNANNGVYLTPAMANCPSYPCLGNWQMTQGSLPSIAVTPDNFSWYIEVPVAGSGALNTVSGLSSALINSYGLREGDIITFVLVYSTADYHYPDLTPDYDPLNPIHWNMTSFRIDTQSPLPVVFPDGLTFGREFNGRFSLEGEGNVAGLCMCVSRNTSSGTKVSTSYLVPTSGTQDFIQEHLTESFHQKVLDAWGTGDPAVLQGGLIADDAVSGYFQGPLWWFANQEDYTAYLQDKSGEDVPVESTQGLKILLKGGKTYDATSTAWCYIGDVSCLVHVADGAVVFRRQNKTPETKIPAGEVLGIIYKGAFFEIRIDE